MKSTQESTVKKKFVTPKLIRYGRLEAITMQSYHASGVTTVTGTLAGKGSDPDAWRDVTW